MLFIYFVISLFHYNSSPSWICL